jgi:hypothetical protein
LAHRDEHRWSFTAIVIPPRLDQSTRQSRSSDDGTNALCDLIRSCLREPKIRRAAKGAVP